MNSGKNKSYRTVIKSCLVTQAEVVAIIPTQKSLAYVLPGNEEEKGKMDKE